MLVENGNSKIKWDQGRSKVLAGAGLREETWYPDRENTAETVCRCLRRLYLGRNAG